MGPLPVALVAIQAERSKRFAASRARGAARHRFAVEQCHIGLSQLNNLRCRGLKAAFLPPERARHIPAYIQQLITNQESKVL
jgi:hypothetical protein